MAASWSGILTLILVLFAGPVVYGLIWFYNKHFRKAEILGKKAVSNTTATADKSSADADPEDQTIENKVITTAQPDEEHDYTSREVLESNEYLIALIGYAIGIGNLWRFPYVIAQNGGCACLVAYLVCLALVAAPLFLYELIIGQHTGLSTIRCYKSIRPRWTSLGYASATMLFFALSYYAMVNAYCLPYVYNSLMDPLPWLAEGSETFWEETILNSYPDLDDKPPGLGPVQANLALSLLGFWIIVVLSAAFGKKILAKVTYVTVILPVVLLLIFVIRTPFLEGAGNGIAFYIGKFEASKLGDLTVWATACSQILFSLSPGFGTAITYSSYIRPKEDVYRTCMIVVLTNSLFSIIGGFAIFSIVGNVAFNEGLPVEEVATRSGAGLAFVTIAEGMQHFGSLSNVMSVLFFFMLLILGLDSAYAWLETIVSYVEDFIQERGWKKRPTWQVTCTVATVLFLSGLPYTTRLGLELLDVVDHYVGTLFLLLVVFLETVMLNVDFGWQRLSYALKKATVGNSSTPKGRSLFPNWLCRLDFHVTVPAISGALGIYILQADIRSPYGDYSVGLNGFGWALFALLVTISFLTIWKQEPSTLQALPDEDDEVVLGNENSEDAMQQLELDEKLEIG